MNIYWKQADIPALKGLSWKEREEVKKPVLGKVWKHWQVWLPFVSQSAGLAAFLYFVPHFHFRLLVFLVLLLITTKLAALPFNHYLQYYLGPNDEKH
jgi:hypothetical protein